MIFKNLLKRVRRIYAFGNNLFVKATRLLKEQPINRRQDNFVSANSNIYNEEKNSQQDNLQNKFVISDEGKEQLPDGNSKSRPISQGVADFSGSSYNGPAKPGENVNSNMGQRNFDNHQSG